MRERLRACAVAGVLFAWLPPLHAQPATADLFEPRTEAAAPVPFGADSILRSRQVRLDAANIARNPRQLRLRDEIRIAFFPDLAETFRRTGSAPRTDGGYIWTGASPRGSVTLVVGGDGVTGYAELGARKLRIDRIAGSLHRIGEIDPRAERPDLVVEVPSPPAAAPAEARAGKTTIDVLVAYTPTAERRSSNIEADIDLAVSLANQAYVASGVEIELRAVDRMRVAYDESGDFRTDLDALAGGKPPFRKVHKARERRGADLVSLIRKGGAFCGIAQLVKRPSPATSDAAFSVVSLDCIAGNHSFAHELGHNMGLQHDRFWLKTATGKTFPNRRIDFGFVNVADQIRDVMAYNDRCARKGVYCTRVNMFSTPREDWQGSVIGKRKGKSGAADAAGVLNANRGAIAGYR